MDIPPYYSHRIILNLQQTIRGIQMQLQLHFCIEKPNKNVCMVRKGDKGFSIKWRLHKSCECFYLNVSACSCTHHQLLSCTRSSNKINIKLYLGFNKFWRSLYRNLLMCYKLCIPLKEVDLSNLLFNLLKKIIMQATCNCFKNLMFSHEMHEDKRP